MELKLVNPYFIRQPPGRKSDVRDAQWIAECLLKDLIKGSFVPEPVVQYMRKLNRRIMDLNENMVYNTNKLDAALQRCDFRMSNYVSKVDSKSYQKVLRAITEGERDPGKLVGLVHGRTVNRHGRETVKAAVTGKFSDIDLTVFRQTREVMDMLVIFFYDDGSRAGEVIKSMTDSYGFKGYLQCDGFGGYTAAFRASPDVTLVFCMVHIRRDFRDAVKENRKLAGHAMAEIQKLYRIEDECDDAGMGYDGRRAEYRREHARPILEGMKKWMEEKCLGFSPKTLIGQAVTYAYTRWDVMYAYLDDGRIRLDNNLSENEIKPITLGRKNWMFCDNHEAVRNMCVIASLLATCRNHNVNPRDYLNDVISRMPYMQQATHQELVAMLPHRWKLTHPGSVMVDFRATQRKTKKK